MYKYPKHYDPKGKAKVLFGIGNEKGVIEFTGKKASEFKIIDHPIFKRAYEVPCEMDYKVSKDEDY